MTTRQLSIKRSINDFKKMGVGLVGNLGLCYYLHTDVNPSSIKGTLYSVIKLLVDLTQGFNGTIWGVDYGFWYIAYISSLVQFLKKWIGGSITTQPTYFLQKKFYQRCGKIGRE